MKIKWYVAATYQDGKQINTQFCYCEGGNAPAEQARRTALEVWAREQHENCICWSVCKC